MVQFLANFSCSKNNLNFFPFKKTDVVKVILLGPYNDCLAWTPSQRPLQHQIKLLQQLTWVNKDLVQFQNQFPILIGLQYSIFWEMQSAQAEKMVRSQGNQEF